MDLHRNLYSSGEEHGVDVTEGEYAINNQMRLAADVSAFAWIKSVRLSISLADDFRSIPNLVRRIH